MAGDSEYAGWKGGLIGLFVRHPNAANLLMVLMILFGAFALLRINTQFFPSVQTNSISVSVAWSGASAEDVEANVLELLEPELRYLDGVKEVVSYAREGSGTVALEFDQNADMQQALSDAESAVASVTNLPDDAETPKVSPSAWFDRVARIIVTGPYGEATLKSIARDVRDALVSAGIDKVDFTGLRDEEIVVTVPERELRRLNLTLADVSAAIASNSRDLPSGTLDGVVSKQIRSLSDVEDVNRMRRVEVRSFASGEKVLLGDIAAIRRTFEEGSEALHRGEPAVELYVQRAPSADTLETNALVDRTLASLEGTLPPGIELIKYDVMSESVAERIGLLVRNGLQGLVIVVTVLFVFLNGRIAFWVAAGIPVALMATLGVMFMSGQSINMISLFALIMMLGVIVDDAIVVGEHTATRSSLGDPPVSAAENGAGRMLMPVAAASLTTIAAFAPLMLVRDTIGQIMIALPLVVIAVVIASLVECFLVLPGHLSHSLGRAKRSGWSFWRTLFLSLTALAALLVIQRAAPSFAIAPARLVEAIGRYEELNAMVRALAIALAAFAIGGLLEGLVQGGQVLRRVAPFLMLGLVWLVGAALLAGTGHLMFGLSWWLAMFLVGALLITLVARNLAWVRDGPFAWLVGLSYAYRYVTVAVAVGLLMLAVSLIMGGRIDFVFFPSPEAESIRARVEFNAGTPREQVLDAVTAIEASLYDVERQLSPGGEPLVVASFVQVGSAGRSEGDNLASIRVQLTSSEEREVRTPLIVEAWREAAPKIAGLKRLAVYEQRGGPPGRDVDVRFRGEDVRLLKLAAEEAAVILADFPGVSGVSDDLPYGKPELVIELTPRGAALGFTSEEIGRQVRNALEGAVPRRFADEDGEVEVRVEAQLRQEGTAALRALELRTPAGNFIPLEEVASLSERQGFSAIQRRDGIASVSVTGDVDLEATTPGEVVEATRPEMRAIAGKYGLSQGFSGRNEERAKAMADLRLGTYIALAVIYIILAWVFGSYARPIAVMLIIPFGFVGAVAGHYWLGFDLTILSMFGLLGLAGILVNDSIILVSRFAERLDAGDAYDEAATGASRDRLRAVLLTSLTTIGGLAPLLTEKSLQAQFLMPMAITMVFGLALATLLVLFLVPALLGIGHDIGRLFGFVAERRLVGDPAE